MQNIKNMGNVVGCFQGDKNQNVNEKWSKCYLSLLIIASAILPDRHDILFLYYLDLFPKLYSD